MTVVEKLNAVREIMKKENVSVYVVTSSDFHDSEYSGEYFESRKFLSGFTGSAGTLIICMDKACLYTDGRYFIQAENELEGSTIELMRQGEKDTISIDDYIKNNIAENTFLATDTRCISASTGVEFEKIVLNEKGLGILDRDFADSIWEERPKMSNEKAFVLDEKYCGESTKDKLCKIREAMQRENATANVLTTLDSIAWLLNIRGNDVEYNPYVLAYIYMDMDKVVLFADGEKFDDKAKESFQKDNIIVKPYNEFYNYLTDIPDETRIMYDSEVLNYKAYKIINEKNNYVDKTDECKLLKAIKNEIQINNLRACHITDGVCVTKFIFWLKKNVADGKLTELSAAKYLDDLRSKEKDYIEPSFSTISAYNSNAAMMHYNPSNGENALLEPSGMLLVDSGGHYLTGTTDITRTISLGEVSDDMRLHYTTVLKGMLNLSAARFLSGTTGRNLDILARGPVWELGIDYKCGTGHGVGYLLGVHEGPNSIRYRQIKGREDTSTILPGMVTTDEPGIYLEGKYGIRIENELLCVNDIKNEHGEFYKFETLTLAPLDRALIDTSIMTKREIKLLNDYNARVYNTLEKYLSEEEKQWLYDESCAF